MENIEYIYKKLDIDEYYISDINMILKVNIISFILLILVSFILIFCLSSANAIEGGFILLSFISFATLFITCILSYGSGAYININNILGLSFYRSKMLFVIMIIMTFPIILVVLVLKALMFLFNKIFSLFNL